MWPAGPVCPLARLSRHGGIEPVRPLGLLGSLRFMCSLSLLSSVEQKIGYLITDTGRK